MAFELVKKEEWVRFVNSYEIHYYKANNKRLPLYKHLIEGELPCRSTMKSAGYDFRIPYDLSVKAGEIYIVGTGVKWYPDDATLSRKGDMVGTYSDGSYVMRDHKDLRSEQVYLALYPRSSYGFNYGFHLLNTTGIIDADYYSNPENDGHIMVGFSTTKDMELKAGDKFCQGIITPYFICGDEVVPTSVRTGGTGSTGK
jgi:dUTP pyrophosphatase